MNICVAVFYIHFLFNPAFGGQLRWTEYELVAFLEIINYNLDVKCASETVHWTVSEDMYN